MPVNTLYCEGDIQSIDMQVLLKIVPDACVIKPIGSKHSFRQRILEARELQPNMIIVGIKDRDFDSDNSKPMNTPHEWYVNVKNQPVSLGWYWERKEIENYLIDPEVVKFALGNKAPPIDQYKTALNKSAIKIASYTAARIALSCVSYPNPPFNYWGEEREMGHFFPKERGLKDSDCRSQISHIIVNKKKEIDALKINILDNFEQLLEECGEGGERFKYYLIFFAGKDLLYMMRSELKKLGFKDSPQPACYVFRERILRGIQSSPEKVWTWLPEWQRLRELIAEFTHI
jgi:hypothetical protein